MFQQRYLLVTGPAMRMGVADSNGSASWMGTTAWFLGKKMHTQHRLKVWGLEKECGELLRARRLCLAVSALFSATRHTVSLQLQQ